MLLHYEKRVQSLHLALAHASSPPRRLHVVWECSPVIQNMKKPRYMLPGRRFKLCVSRYFRGFAGTVEERKWLLDRVLEISVVTDLTAA